MMHVLTPAHWCKFKADGILFEKLVGELLKAEFGINTFKATKWSHDGSRDFEAALPLLVDAKAKIWVECKYHTKKPLPVHDVSMTLFMAYIEHANQILFFSYNAVNRNFMRYIAQYTAKSGKDVRVYDDAVLEELILTNKHKILFHEYFPNIQQSAIRPIGKPVYCMYSLHGAESEQGKTVLSINQVSHLELYFVNRTAQCQTACYKIISGKTQDAITILDTAVRFDKQARVDLPPVSSIVVKIPFCLKKYTSRFYLPAVEVSLADGYNEIKRISRPVYCKWLAQTEVIGMRNRQFLTDVKELLEKSRVFSPVLLDGTGGVGKSRLLKEIEIEGISGGKQVISIDSDNKRLSTNVFLAKLVSALEELPLFSAKHMLRLRQSRVTQSSIEANQYALRILYDPTFDAKSEEDSLVRYLGHLMCNKKCLIILDNLQNFDELSLRIIELLYAYMDGQSCNCVVIFCFNTDFLYKGTHSYQIYQRLKRICKRGDGVSLAFTATPFTHTDTVEFIRSCLRIESSDEVSFSETIERISRKSVPTPFFLQQLLLHLALRHVIDQVHDQFYVRNVTGFANELEAIPSDIVTFVAKRIESFEEARIHNRLDEEYTNFAQLLVLVRSLPSELYKGIIGSQALLQEMIQSGLVCMEGGRICYSHQYIEGYYRQIYSLNLLDNRLLLQFIKVAESSYYVNEMRIPVFLARFYYGTIRPEDFELATNTICEWQVDAIYCKPVFRAYHTLLNNRIFSLEPERYVRAYGSMADCLLASHGIRTSLPYRLSAADSFCSEPLRFTNCLPELFNALFEMFTNMINIYQTDKSLEENKRMQRHLQSTFSKHREQPAIMSKLLIYEAFAHSYLDRIDQALLANQTAMSYALKAEDMRIAIEVEMLRGDIYYQNSNCCSYTQDITLHWRNAYAQFEQHFGAEARFTDALYLEAFMRNWKAQYIGGYSETMPQFSTTAARFLNQTKMMFFEIKLRQLMVVEYLLQDSINSEEFQYCTRLVGQALDQCVIYGNEKEYIDCFHILALLHLKNGSHSAALNSYTKAIYALLQEDRDEHAIREKQLLLFDAAVAFRRNGEEMPLALTCPSGPRDIQERMYNILHMPYESFEEYRKSDEHKYSPFYDPINDFNLPKV